MIARDCANVICRWKGIFVAVFDANLRVKLQRDHTAHFVEDFQEFHARHVIIAGAGRNPKLHDCFRPMVDPPAAVDRIDGSRFQLRKMITVADLVSVAIDKKQSVLRRNAQFGDEFVRLNEL